VKNTTRRAYLLRCWPEGSDAPGPLPRWRFSVEEVLCKQPRRGFNDLESLLDFLRAELAGGQDAQMATFSDREGGAQ
jgi:hypothetical protein